jgi:hypothetical protein
VQESAASEDADEVEYPVEYRSLLHLVCTLYCIYSSRTHGLGGGLFLSASRRGVLYPAHLVVTVYCILYTLLVYCV